MHRAPLPAPAATRWFLALLIVATVLLNAAKPLVMDDSLYLQHASQIAHDPANPYGFTLAGYDGPLPSMHLLSPVLLQYWWSPAVAIFGDAPFFWKLWLAPVQMAFVLSLFALFRRFAPGLALPLTALTAVSPTYLPCVNLMLDVPSLALGLTGLAVFLRAIDDDRPRLALLAGLTVGAAAQVKYTGLLMPAVLMTASILARRPRLGLIAAAAFTAVFLGWEAAVFAHHGESHFLHQLALREGQDGSRLITKLNLIKALLSNLGGLTPVLSVVGLVVLGRRPARIAILAAVIALLFAAATARANQGAGEVLFLVLAGVFVVVLSACIRNLLRIRIRTNFHTIDASAAPLDLDRFLLAWLALEVVATLVLSPFAATRRLMGIVLVATLLIGRLASRIHPEPPPALRRRVVTLAAAGAALGLAFYVTEYRDASAVERGATASARYARSRDLDAGRPRPGALWYVGRWGFRYYADRAGMKIITPGRDRLEPGDWLAVPDASVIKPALRIDPGALDPAATITVSDPWPLRTLPVYYNGPVPWHPGRGPRFTVHLFRVTRPAAAELDTTAPGVRYHLAAVAASIY